jgi:cell division transport system permease protein
MNDRSRPQRLRAWGRRQLYSFFSSLGSLANNAVGTLMTVAVLGIAMALPLALYVAVDNFEAVDLKKERWGSLSVYLVESANEADAQSLATLLRDRYDTRVEVVSPDEGLASFREASGFGDVLDLLDGNPLPWVLHVTPAEEGEGGLEARVAQLAAWIEAREAVDAVQVDYRWLQRLEAFVGLARSLVAVLTAVFALAVLVIVANTIRLDVANRAGEIEVLHLVGAPNGFIRLPFLFAGFWYGVLGAVLALSLLSVALLYLSAPAERLLDAYGNSLRLEGPGLVDTAGLLAAGGLLGLAGSWVAVGRHLRRFRLADAGRAA